MWYETKLKKLHKIISASFVKNMIVDKLFASWRNLFWWNYFNELRKKDTEMFDVSKDNNNNTFEQSEILVDKNKPF